MRSVTIRLMHGCRGWSSWIVATTVITLGSACGGNDGSSLSTQGTDGSETEASAETASPDDSGEGCPLPCFAIPDGWSGPVVVGAPTDCSAAFPEEVFTLATTLETAEGSCACACGGPAEVTCTNATVTQHATDNCGGQSDVIEAAPGCAPAAVPLTAGSYSATFPESAVNCTATTTEDLPPTQIGGEVRACAPTTTQSCDGAVCVAPAPLDFSRTCIHREGLHECTNGTFVVRQIAFANFEDTRACNQETCECDGFAAPCSGTISLTNDCDGDEGVIVDGCVSSSGAASVRVDVTPPTVGDCNAKNPTFNTIGTVEATGMVTLCCLD